MRVRARVWIRGYYSFLNNIFIFIHVNYYRHMLDNDPWRYMSQLHFYETGGTTQRVLAWTSTSNPPHPPEEFLWSIHHHLVRFVARIFQLLTQRDEGKRYRLEMKNFPLGHQWDHLKQYPWRNEGSKTLRGRRSISSYTWTLEHLGKKSIRNKSKSTHQSWGTLSETLLVYDMN